jgi:hypothetical protein
VAAPSYEQINYALRPAKNIERKMISDVLRRLRAFAPLHVYRYVGFGSAYFSDFTLLHKALDLRTMISIEKDIANRDRFEFNRPFSCVEMAYGTATAILPTLDWDYESIVWLDYDSKIKSYVLADLAFACMEAKPGSALIVTVNAHPDDDIDGRVEILNESVGPDNVPSDIRAPADLAGWKMAEVSRRILENTIQATLRDRNAGGADAEEIHYEQLFNFHYQDGPKMLTVGGILYRADQKHLLATCAFQDFDYARNGADAYRIEVPNLTFREMRHLNAQLPDADPPEAPGVPATEVGKYERVYRFFPAFVDAEI